MESTGVRLLNSNKIKGTDLRVLKNAVRIDNTRLVDKSQRQHARQTKQRRSPRIRLRMYALSIGFFFYLFKIVVQGVRVFHLLQIVLRRIVRVLDLLQKAQRIRRFGYKLLNAFFNMSAVEAREANGERM